MNAELKSAALRLSRCSPPDSVHEGIYASMDEMASDAVPVARDYLSRLAAEAQRIAEEALPVDEAWLREIGAEDYERAFIFWADHHRHTLLHAYRGGGCWLWAFGTKEYLPLIQNHPQNRGAALKLLAALGIEPKKAGM